MRYPFLNPHVVRFLVYRLHDAQDRVVYVGRSCDPVKRIREHVREAKWFRREKAAWVFDVRRVSMLGPFNFYEADRLERSEIEALQPRGNVLHTKAYGFRPLSEGGGRLWPFPPPLGRFSEPGRPPPVPARREQRSA